MSSSAYFRQETFGYDDPTFARGYLLSDTDALPVAAWITRQIGSRWLHFDPRNRFVQCGAGKMFVAVLGLAIDVERPAATPEQTADRALTALVRSRAEFLDECLQWSGRFLLIYCDGERTRALTDATGMRTAFYSDQGDTAVASHGRLIADRLSLARNAGVDVVAAHRMWATKRTKYLPGSMTHWQGVRMLTANMELDLGDCTLHRVWPSAALKPLGVDAAAAEVTRLMEGQIEWLERQGRPLLASMTAGVDTRVVLSLLAGHQSVRYFTYRRPDHRGEEVDVDVSTQMAMALGVDYRVVDIERGEGLDLDAVVENNHPLVKDADVIAAMKRSFPQNTIHIRSNISEVGRRFWKMEVGEDLNPRQMAELWRGMGEVPEVVDAFADWAKRVGFADVGGVDASDLLYWEHRMSAWHGPRVLEVDIVMDSISLFNQRGVLTALLAVPRRNRSSSDVHRAVVADRQPALLQWPINSADKPWDASSSRTKRENRSLGTRVHRLLMRFFPRRDARG